MSRLKSTNPEEDAERYLIVCALEHHTRVALDYLIIRAGGTEDDLANYLGIPREVVLIHRNAGFFPLYHLRDLLALGEGLIEVSDLIPYLTGYPGIPAPQCRSGIWRNAEAGELRPLEDLERLIRHVGLAGLSTAYVRRRIVLGKHGDKGWWTKYTTPADPQQPPDKVREFVKAIQQRQHLDDTGFLTPTTLTAEDLHRDVAAEFGGKGSRVADVERIVRGKSATTQARGVRRIKGLDEEME